MADATESKQRSDAITLSVAISAIYIGIASGLLIFILQTANDLTSLNFSIFSSAFCIFSIIFHMFAGEFFMLSIWHQNKISLFAWYGSVCYGIGQAFLFIGIAFVVRLLGYKILSILFLSLIILFWILYYFIRVRNVSEPDHSLGRWFARGIIFTMYLFSLMSLIKY
jgi:hypothetical protein